MADDYTPTTEEVRRYYVEGRLSAHDGSEPASSAQFERWQDAFVESIRERIAQDIEALVLPNDSSPAADWFRTRAAGLARGATRG